MAKPRKFSSKWIAAVVAVAALCVLFLAGNVFVTEDTNQELTESVAQACMRNGIVYDELRNVCVEEGEVITRPAEPAPAFTQTLSVPGIGLPPSTIVVPGGTVTAPPGAPVTVAQPPGAPGTVTAPAAPPETVTLAAPPPATETVTAPPATVTETQTQTQTETQTVTVTAEPPPPTTETTTVTTTVTETGPPILLPGIG